MTERERERPKRRFAQQIFTDSPLKSWKFRHLEGAGFSQKPADFRRKPKIFAENCRKPQIGLRHLRSVTFSLALVKKHSFGRVGGAFAERPHDCLDLMSCIAL